MRTADIDALARLLDGDPATNGEAPAEARLLSSLAQAMESRAAGTMRPDFRDELRASLIAEAAKPVLPTLLERTRLALDERLARIRYSAKVATATGMAALTLSTGGVAAATTMAVPGDLLYPVKLTVEDLRLDRADGLERATVLLAMTEKRIGEAERAAAAGRQDSAAEALVAADAALRDAAGVLIGSYQESRDRAVLTALEDMRDSVADRLVALEGTLSGDALRALQDLQVAFERIDERIAAVTGECCQTATGAEPGVPPVGKAFDFGSIPPADEPFAACPCPAATVPGTARPPALVPDLTPAPTPEPTEPPVDSTTPPPGSDPDPEPPAPSEEPPRKSPNPVDEAIDPVEDVLPPPVKDATDPLKDVLDNVIDQAPVDIDDATDPIKPGTDALEPITDAVEPVTDPLQNATEELGLPGLTD